MGIVSPQRRKSWVQRKSEIARRTSEASGRKWDLTSQIRLLLGVTSFLPTDEDAHFIAVPVMSSPPPIRLGSVPMILEFLTCNVEHPSDKLFSPLSLSSGNPACIYNLITISTPLSEHFGDFKATALIAPGSAP